MKKINCILLVDDNSADNIFHKIAIRKADVCNHVQVATDGRSALSYITKAGEPIKHENFPKPNIIFLDINMPGMNGFDFLEEYQLLDEKLKSEVVIIMLTTSLTPRDQKRAMEVKEVTEFQNKPLTVEMIKGIVERYF